ncbi:MAG: hypothetical protein AB7O97_16370 [Planctomycetota bacterium]
MTATRTPDSSHPVPGPQDRQPAARSGQTFVLPSRDGARTLPAPPARNPATLVVRGEFGGQGTALLRREARGLPPLGERLRSLLASQDHLLGELRGALAGRGEAAAVLDWCEAVQAELWTEADHAACGLQAIDLLGLCHDVLHDGGGVGGDVGREVRIVGAPRHAVWGRIETFGHLLRLAIDLVDARTAGLGDLVLEAGEDEAGPFLAVRGHGRGRAEPAAGLIADFRVAAAECGVRVVPDASGADGPGLELRVPSELRGPLLPRD